jgi:hypothetical protein
MDSNISRRQLNVGAQPADNDAVQFFAATWAPATVRAAMKSVTVPARKNDGFRKGSTHPTLAALRQEPHTRGAYPITENMDTNSSAGHAVFIRRSLA